MDKGSSICAALIWLQINNSFTNIHIKHLASIDSGAAKEWSEQPPAWLE